MPAEQSPSRRESAGEARMSSDVRIEQVRLADEPALLSFLGAAYPEEPRKSERAYWRWHYLEHPLAGAENIPVWAVWEGSEIVGQAATIPAEVSVTGERLCALWILDFIIDPRFRGQGLGKRLLVEAWKKCPTHLALGFNEQSERVLRSLKWEWLGGVRRYQRLLFPGDTLKEVARLKPLRTLVNLSAAPFRPARARLLPGAGYEVRAVEEFDASFDDLWRRAAGQWPCAVVREARYLDWQFRRQPGKRFDVLTVLRGGRLAGYAVLFFRAPEQNGVPPKASIADICYDAEAPGIVEEILKASLGLALERRAGSLVTDVADARIEASLGRLGFWRIKHSPSFMAGTSVRREAICNPANWFLTRADSDVSIFEQPNL